jgi:hypothetical protein
MATIARLHVISALVLETSQQVSAQDHFVVAPAFESSLREKRNDLADARHPGAKIRFARTAQWSCANFIEFLIV